MPRDNELRVWSSNEAHAVVAVYRLRNRALCPRCLTLVTATEGTAPDGGKPDSFIRFNCLQCGGAYVFWS